VCEDETIRSVRTAAVNALQPGGKRQTWELSGVFAAFYFRFLKNP
jgi:hypothetical protein